jgi:hypothetical protein
MGTEGLLPMDPPPAMSSPGNPLTTELLIWPLQLPSYVRTQDNNCHPSGGFSLLFHSGRLKNK